LAGNYRRGLNERTCFVDSNTNAAVKVLVTLYIQKERKKGCHPVRGYLTIHISGGAVSALPEGKPVTLIAADCHRHMDLPDRFENYQLWPEGGHAAGENPVQNCYLWRAKQNGKLNGPGDK
jgi:hypothetical protein